MIYAWAILGLTDDLRRHFRRSGDIVTLRQRRDADAAVEAKTVDLAVMRRHPAYPEAQTLWSFVSVESGLRAGLGVCAVPRRLPRFGLALLDGAGLPDLPKVEYVMATPDRQVDGAFAAFTEILRLCAGSSFRLAASDPAFTGAAPYG